MPARERECTACPPWVVRCAHWDGVMVLGDGVAVRQSHTCGDPAMDFSPFELHSGELVNCTRGLGCDAMVVDCDRSVCVGFQNAEDGHAEFARREAMLLGREVPA